ncbi:hypothetical protein B0T18DRAFT_389579 [Schizothecium vesticola]|uniref:Uncharacterized protein n=1 Tax=Schizothecium vesticola TaxID=314040 RepID=A0AA40F2S6_9PEZI|nr:hypothetical protein B0T18DRAFT_389579 [Schizothecium vesticola]
MPFRNSPFGPLSMLIAVLFMVVRLITSAPTGDEPNTPATPIFAIAARPDAVGPTPLLPAISPGSLEILPRNLKNPENEAGGRVKYPWNRAEPTFNNAVNETDLSLTRECLALWCEQDIILQREAGLASCLTDGRRPEGGARAYICNFRQAARCSRHDIDTAAQVLEDQGSRTGLYHHVPTKKFGLAIGFDRFCEGSQYGCGRYYDPMFSNCQDLHKKMWSTPIQYEKLVAGPKDIGVYDYEGIAWIDKGSTPEQKKDTARVFGLSALGEDKGTG